MAVSLKNRWTFAGDITSVLRDTDTVRRDTGTVISVEPRYRVWKESYVKGSWEYLNTAPSLRLGTSTQVGIGVGSFVASGVELEIMYKDLKATELGVDSRETNVWSQLHFFF